MDQNPRADMQASGKFARWSAILVIVAVTIATRAPYYGDPAPSFDEQLYNLIGRHMLSGSLPYVDLWDRKPIGLFLLYAFSNWVAGWSGISSALSYQLLATVFGLAGALLTWRLASRLKPGVAAMAVGAFYPMLMARFGSQAGQSEAFFVPLMVGALALVEQARHSESNKSLKLCLAAMFVCGVALQIKYTVAMQCIFLGFASLWILYRRGFGLGRIGAIAVLFALVGVLPTAAAWLPYALSGHSQEFLFANFISIFDRGSPPETKLHRLLPNLWLPATCIMLGLSSLVDRREKPAGTYLLYTGWTVSCLAGLFMGSTIYAYYLAALAPGALLMAIPVLALLGPVSIFVLLGGLLLAYDIPGRFEYSHKSRASIHRLTRLVAPHVGSKEHCLFVYDGPSALYDTVGSCLPTRFIYPDHLNNNLERKSLGIDQAAEVRRIFSHEPGAVITANRAVTAQNEQSGEAVKDALARDYRKLGTIAFNGRILTVHVRKDEPTAPAPAGS